MAGPPTTDDALAPTQPPLKRRRLRGKQPAPLAYVDSTMSSRETTAGGPNVPLHVVGHATGTAENFAALFEFIQPEWERTLAQLEADEEKHVAAEDFEAALQVATQKSDLQHTTPEFIKNKFIAKDPYDVLIAQCDELVGKIVSLIKSPDADEFLCAYNRLRSVSSDFLGPTAGECEQPAPLFYDVGNMPCPEMAAGGPSAPFGSHWQCCRRLCPTRTIGLRR